MNGEADAEIVLRTGEFVAFLVVPVTHVVTFDQLPADLGGALVAVGQRLVQAVESAMDADGSLMIVNNIVSQSVPHLHLHVIPRTRRDGLRLWLGPRHPYGSTAERAATGARIRAALDAGPRGQGHMP